MVTRRHQILGEVHGPDQTISLLDALKTFTINGAFLTYDDEVRGSLVAGNLADFDILDADLPTVPPEDLLGMSGRVLMTVVGGEVVNEKPGDAPN